MFKVRDAWIDRHWEFWPMAHKAAEALKEFANGPATQTWYSVDFHCRSLLTADVMQTVLREVLGGVWLTAGRTAETEAPGEADEPLRATGSPTGETPIEEAETATTESPAPATELPEPEATDKATRQNADEPPPGRTSGPRDPGKYYEVERVLKRQTCFS